MLFPLRIPIRIKLAVALSLLMSFITIFIGIVMTAQQRTSLETQMRNMASTITDKFAGDSKMPLLQNDNLTMNLLVQNALKYPGIENAYILNEKLLVEGHKEIEELGTKYSRYKESILNAKGAYPWLIQENKSSFTFATPIVFQETTVGYAVILFSKGFIMEKVRETQKRMALITISVLAIVLIVSIPLASGLLKPVFTLVKGTKEIALGNLWYRISPGKKDEIGELIDSFNHMASELEKKEILKGAFSRYVSPLVADEILKKPDEIRLAGERRKVTVLFADIRGFTALTRQMQPEEIVELLNRYFTILTEIIFYFDGTVDKFIGDAVMGVFGSPIPTEKHLRQGVRAAIVINKIMTEANRSREKRGLIQLPMGFGLDSGHVIVGSMGSNVRMEYTAIGDTVNVASRLSGLAKNREILISEKVYKEIESETSCTRMPDTNIKGIENLFTIYNITDIKEVWKPAIDDAIYAIKDKMRREKIAL